MSYTFTSPVKNVANNETLNHCSEIRKKLDGIYERVNTILMVGWRHDSDAAFVRHMIRGGKKVTIVEVFAENLKSIPAEITAVLSDIRDYEVKEKFDLLLWQHGPEHVHKTDLVKFLNQYEKMFKYIILETPNGHLPQGPMYGNPYEEHISTWGPQDYEELGYEYVTYAGQYNMGFIIAYKQNEDSSHS